MNVRFFAPLTLAALLLSGAVAVAGQSTKGQIDASPVQRLDVMRSRLDSMRRSLNSAIAAVNSKAMIAKLQRTLTIRGSVWPAWKRKRGVFFRK